MKVAIAAAAVALLAACHEIPQYSAKSFAPKPDTQLYDGARFGGDKEKFEKALAQRAQGQDEYHRVAKE